MSGRRSGYGEPAWGRARRRIAVGCAAVAIVAAAVALFGGFGGEPLAADVGPADPSPELHKEVPTPSASSSQSRRAATSAGPGRLWPGSGFRVAVVRKGEWIGVHERPRGRLIERAGPKTEFGSRLAFGVVDRRGRWLEVTTPIAEDNRRLWIKADPDRIEFRTTPISIHVSLPEREVEIREAGKVLHRFAATIGAVGSSTPAGRFAVTDVIVDGLNPVYGCCAFALSARQPDLPESWVGGDRIAIHGTTGAVGTASSNGCIRLSDEDAERLVGLVPLGAPVFIRA